MPLLTSAQRVGVNAAGFFENLTEESIDSFAAAVGDYRFILRAPGGAIAKYAITTESSGGWGITEESINYINENFISSEEEDISHIYEKWTRKMDEQPDYSYLESLVDLQKRFPNMEVSYAVNVYFGVDVAMHPIAYLLQHGVRVKYVELGSETYSQVGYNFDLFQSLTTPIRDSIDALGLIPCYPVPAFWRKPNSQKIGWANNLNSFFSYNPAYFVPHFYFNEREFPAAVRPITDTALLLQQIQSYDFDSLFSYVNSYMSNASGAIVTESNSQPADLIGNTEANRILMDSVFAAGVHNYSAYCIHNGIAADKYGILYGQNRGEELVVNTTYSSFKYYVQNPIDYICDSIIVDYVDILDTIVVGFEPTGEEACGKCVRWFFRFFNRRYCRDCEPPSIRFITEVFVVETKPVYEWFCEYDD